MADFQQDSLSAAHALVPAAKMYRSLSEVQSHEKVDMVDICTPPSTHAALILEALEAGLHVLCEKPLVLSLEEFDRIRNLAEKKGRIVYSVHNWKWSPQFMHIRDLLKDGVIGSLFHFEIHTLRTAPAFATLSGNTNQIWRLNPLQSGGGILVDHGWHLFSLALDFMGELPNSIGARLTQERFTQTGLEDTALCTLNFPSAKALLYMSWAEKKRRNTGIFLGEKGSIILDDDRVLLNLAQRHTEVKNFTDPVSKGSIHQEWFENMLSDFLWEFEHPEKRANLLEAQGCLRLLLDAYESHRKSSAQIVLKQREPVSTL